MFPFVWRAYDRPCPGDLRSLIGTDGIAEEKLAPSGHVRVHGELWQAEVVGECSLIGKGEIVRIEGIRGLKLLVRPLRWKKDIETTIQVKFLS